MAPGAFYKARTIELDNFFSEGITEIPDLCFIEAGNTGTLNTPASLRRIGNYAFYGNGAWTKQINLNEGLQEVGEYAFIGDNSDNMFTLRLDIPSTCLKLGRGAFSCLGIVYLNLPESLREIPYECFACDGLISSVTLPSSLRVIGDRAFAYAFSTEPINEFGEEVLPLKYLEIHEGVYKIGCEAFVEAGFETFKFPSTTKLVGADCLKKAVSGDILIAASTPPECYTLDGKNLTPIFSGLESHTLYVPV